MEPRVLLGLVLGLAVALGLLRARAFIRSVRAARRARRARAGERSARALLTGRGYEIVREQAEGVLTLAVDGAPSVHALRADFLVRRGARRFVAEVKTGALAPSLEHAPTRRQILEYCAAFDVDGALLVDAEAGRVHEIALPFRAHTDRRIVALALCVGLVVGGVLATGLR